VFFTKINHLHNSPERGTQEAHAKFPFGFLLSFAKYFEWQVAYGKFLFKFVNDMNPTDRLALAVPVLIL